MSDLLESDNNSVMARTLLSGTRFYSVPLNADSIDDPRSSHLEFDPLDALGVALKDPHSEGGYNSTSMNVNNDIVGETPRHQGIGSPDVRAEAGNPPDDEFELSNSTTDINNDIDFCIKQVNLENLITLWNQMLWSR